LLAFSTPDANIRDGFLLGVMVLGGLAWAARKADRKVVHGLLLLYVLALAAWTFTTVSQQTSDFGVYLRCGAPLWNKVDSFQQWAHQCQSAWLPGNPTFWRRSLLYTLPIGMLGGNEYLTLRIVNACMHLAAVVALYHIVSRWTTRQQGVLAASALAIFPEYWFTTSLATSDNLAIPLLVLWLGLVAGSGSDEMPAWKVIAAAVVGVSLDLLRDIGLVCVLTTLLLAVLTHSRDRWKLLFLSGLTFGLMVFAGRLGALLAPVPADIASLLARLTGHGITSTAAWADNYRWNQYIYPLLDPQTRNRYFAGLLTMDLQHGMTAAFQNWGAKIQVLFQGDGYFYYSTAPLDGNPDNLPIGGTSPASPPSIVIRFVLKGLTAAITILALIGGVRSRSQGLGKGSIAFSCAFLFLVIGFGEIQPRYATLLGPALSIMIAGLLAPQLRSTVGVAAEFCKSIAVFVGAVAIALFTLTAVLGKLFAAAPPFTGFKQESTSTVGGISCNATSASVSMEERFARIRFPTGQRSCYSFVVRTAAYDQPLFIQVVRDPILPRWKSPPALPVTVNVLNANTVDSPSLASTSLHASVAETLHIPATKQGGKLRIVVIVDGELDESMQGVVIGFIRTASGQPVRLLSSTQPN